jgi:sugar/nucleoside kinase (ribokinase family)
MHPSRGLFLGLTTVDIFYGVEKHPGANEKVQAKWQLIYSGGPAANAAVAYAALGNDSHLVTGLGVHPTAQLAAADLDEYDVTLHDFAVSKDDPPILSSILVNSLTGDRCVVYSNTDTRLLENYHEIDELLDNAVTVLLDGYYLPQAMILAEAAKSRNVTVILDGGSWKEGLEHLLAYVDIAVCSVDFQPPGCRNADDLFTYFAHHKVDCCAVSNGGEQVVGYGGGASWTIDVPAVPAIDTLGAGDILHGAFCHYIATLSFKESLERAVKIASDSCCYYGTRQWIRHLEKFL